MNDFAAAFQRAFVLIVGFDAELREIVVLSLAVSLSASAFAFAIGAPLGTSLAVYRFRGRQAFIVIANALLGCHRSSSGLSSTSCCPVPGRSDRSASCLRLPQ